VQIDEHGNPKGELSRGEQKSLQTERVVLVPGPDQEQDRGGRGILDQLLSFSD